MKPKAARVLPPMMSNNSHSVNIICEESVQYSLVSHLSAALRREGISVFVDSCGFQETKPFSVEQNQAVTDGARVSVVVISNMVELFDPWVLKFLKVIKRRRNSGHMVVPVFYGVDPLNRVYGWANRRLEAEKLTSHQSRCGAETRTSERGHGARERSRSSWERLAHSDPQRSLVSSGAKLTMERGLRSDVTRSLQLGATCRSDPSTSLPSQDFKQ